SQKEDNVCRANRALSRIGKKTVLCMGRACESVKTIEHDPPVERFSPYGPSVGRFPIRARIPTPCPVLTPWPLSLRERGNDGEEKESRMRAQLRRRLEMAERVRDFLRTQQTVLTAARATLENATGQKDVLVALGMSQKVLEDLTATVSEFERTLAASREGRREHVGASAELEAVFGAIAEQVQLLDGVEQL